MSLAILGAIDTTYAAYQSKIMKLTNLKQVKCWKQILQTKKIAYLASKLAGWVEDLKISY